MATALIKISYRRFINSNTKDPFEQYLLTASYEEFLMKSQTYNLEGKYKTFTELKASDGRANSLHYKSGFAIGGFMEKLNKKIPGLYDTAGQQVLFDIYRFELIESNIADKSAHTIAIHYITDTLTLINSFGDNLLLAYGDKTEQLKDGVEDCFMMKLNENISIVSYTL